MPQLASVDEIVKSVVRASNGRAPEGRIEEQQAEANMKGDSAKFEKTVMDSFKVRSFPFSNGDPQGRLFRELYVECGELRLEPGVFVSRALGSLLPRTAAEAWAAVRKFDGSSVRRPSWRGSGSLRWSSGCGWRPRAMRRSPIRSRRRLRVAAMRPGRRGRGTKGTLCRAVLCGLCCKYAPRVRTALSCQTMPTGDAVTVLLPNGTYADGTRLDSDSTAGTAVIHLDSGDVIHAAEGEVMQRADAEDDSPDWLLEASDIAREELPAIETTPTVGPTPDFEEEMVSPPLPAFDESMPDWLFEAAEEMGIDTTIPVSPPPPRASTPPPPRASTPPPPSPPQPQQFSDSTAAADKRPLQPLPLNSTEGPRSGAKTFKRGSTTAEHDDDGGLASGLARLDATMKSMEAEVATRRLEQLSACQTELEASEAKRTKQEKVLQRLMRELREEKVRAAAKHNASALVERLREEVLQKVAHASARVVGLHECVQKDLGAAAERLCARAAADEARATARVGEMEAAMAAARMGELAAHEARGRSEARAAALEARATRRRRDSSPRSSANRRRSTRRRRPPRRSASFRHTDDASDEGRRHRLRLARPAADWRARRRCDARRERRYNSTTTTSNTPPTEAHYTGLLEHELSTALSELSTTKQIAKELETELSTARLKACGDDQASRGGGARGGGGGGRCPLRGGRHGRELLLRRSIVIVVVVDTRQRAAAAARLRSSALEGAKSQRLEKIISRLMSELRTSKVEAAGRRRRRTRRARPSPRLESASRACCATMRSRLPTSTARCARASIRRPSACERWRAMMARRG